MSGEQVTRKGFIGLFLAGLVVAIAAAVLQPVPGYMDADYYYAGALRLVSGQGASEPYLWNYLNAPSELPAPAFSYWMPLVSLLAAGGLAAAPSLGFWGARLAFLFLAALVPPLTALLSLRLTRQPASARLAGLLALFPVYYLAYITTTDAFAVYMVLGALFLLLAVERGGWLAKYPPEARLFLLGLLAGLLHLARADGLLWLGAAGLVALSGFRQLSRSADSPLRGYQLVTFALAVLAGYVLVMAPWYARNLGEWGWIFPPGNSRAVWITEYEQTMIYPASLLTPQHWLSAGWAVHLQARWDAFLNHLQSALAVQGQIVLFPFILAGLWKLRGCAEVRLGVLMWLVTLAVMTLVFPFAGLNGGFFHSGAAVQPLFWAVAPLGIESLMLAYARWRRLGWPQRMVRFMSALLVITGVLLTLLIYVQRVGGSEPGVWEWSASDQHYRAVEQVLVEQGAGAGERVLVNNPPGFWLASNRPAVVVPYGDERTLLAAARQYGIRYLVLEQNNPYQLSNLYHSGHSLPELEYLTSVGTTKLYRIDLSQ